MSTEWSVSECPDRLSEEVALTARYQVLNPQSSCVEGPFLMMLSASWWRNSKWFILGHCLKIKGAEVTSTELSETTILQAEASRRWNANQRGNFRAHQRYSEDADGGPLCLTLQDQFYPLLGSVPNVPLEMQVSSTLSCAVRVSWIQARVKRFKPHKPDSPAMRMTGSDMHR